MSIGNGSGIGDPQFETLQMEIKFAKVHCKEFRGECQAQTASFCARRVSPDRRLVQARLARAKKAVATIRWYVPAALWQVTYERQEGLQNIAELYFNIEIKHTIFCKLSCLSRDSWAQPLVVLSFHRAFRSEHGQWLWDWVPPI